MTLGLTQRTIEAGEGSGAVTISYVAETARDEKPLAYSGNVVAVLESRGETARSYQDDYVFLFANNVPVTPEFAPVRDDNGEIVSWRSTGTASLEIIDDLVDEDTETLRVTLTRGRDFLVSGRDVQIGTGTAETSVRITIEDDDATPEITGPAAFEALSNSVAVFATLTAEDLDANDETLTWTIVERRGDGGAFRLTPDGRLSFNAPKDFDRPDDYSSTSEFADGEYVLFVRVSDGTNVSVPRRTTVTLVAAPEVSIAVDEAEIVERPVSGVEVPEDATFTLTRSGELSFGATVLLTVSEDAGGNTFYGEFSVEDAAAPLPRIVVFAPGDTVKRVMFNAVDSIGAYRPPARVTVAVAPGDGYPADGYSVSATAGSASVRVRDVDAPEMTVSVRTCSSDPDHPFSVLEGAGAFDCVIKAATVRDEEPFPGSVVEVVLGTEDGTATAGVDYTGVSGQAVSIEDFRRTGGGTWLGEAMFSIDILEDKLDESGFIEDFFVLLSLSPGVGEDVRIGESGKRVRLTITDDDASPVITSPDAFEAFDNSMAVFATLTAEDLDENEETLAWTIVGTAADEDAFMLTPDGQLSFATAKNFDDPDDTDGDGVYGWLSRRCRSRWTRRR